MGINVIDSGMNSAMPDVSSLVVNSPDQMLHRTAGTQVSKSITVIGDGGETAYNLFAFTGAIELLEIFGRVTEATDVTSVTLGHLDAYDGGATLEIAAGDFGFDLSGVTVGSLIFKVAASDTAATVLNASQIRVDETRDDRHQARGITLMGKNGVTNYVRFLVTTDMATDCDITWYATWRALGSATFVAA